MPRRKNEEQAKVAKLTEAELQAQLQAKQKEVEELRKRDQQAAKEQQKQLETRQIENLDKLIRALTEHEEKVKAARDLHEKRSGVVRPAVVAASDSQDRRSWSKHPSVVAEADKELKSKLQELESALALFRQGLELPYGCPQKLEAVKVFQAQHLKRLAEIAAYEKTADAENKKLQAKYEAEDALRLLNQEKSDRELKEKTAKIEAHDKQLVEKAHKNYSVWHKTLGALTALGICFAIAPAIPTTAAAYAILAGAALLGAYVGGSYRNSVIEAGKKYRFKEDVEAQQDQWYANDTIDALKAGVEAATWKGYFNSFGHAPSHNHPKEFKAGMIQAITQNEEVVKAIRNR